MSISILFLKKWNSNDFLRGGGAVFSGSIFIKRVEETLPNIFKTFPGHIRSYNVKENHICLMARENLSYRIQTINLQIKMYNQTTTWIQCWGPFLSASKLLSALLYRLGFVNNSRQYWLIKKTMKSLHWVNV